MTSGLITLEVIFCPGDLGNKTYSALQLNVEGFRSPYVLTMALRTLGYKALAEQADPAAVFRALAEAVNGAEVAVALTTDRNQSLRGASHA